MQWPTRRSSAFSIMSSKSHQSSWDDGDVINPALGDGGILQPVQRGGSSGSSMLANSNFPAFGNYFVLGYCHLLAVKTTKWCALIPPVIRTGFEGGEVDLSAKDLCRALVKPHIHPIHGFGVLQFIAHRNKTIRWPDGQPIKTKKMIALFTLLHLPVPVLFFRRGSLYCLPKGPFLYWKL